MIVVVCEDERVCVGWYDFGFSRRGNASSHGNNLKFTHPNLHKFGFESLYLVSI